MMLISVSLNLLFLTLFIRSFSEFKNNKFVLPTYVTVVLIQWYLNRNGMTFYGRWIILLLNLCYIMYMYKGKISKKLIATVYKGNIIKNLIMDCQSYTKYRPNETTGGIFVSWRRKEELPTGA